LQALPGVKKKKRKEKHNTWLNFHLVFILDKVN